MLKENHDDSNDDYDKDEKQQKYSKTLYLVLMVGALSIFHHQVNLVFFTPAVLPAQRQRTPVRAVSNRYRLSSSTEEEDGSASVSKAIDTTMQSVPRTSAIPSNRNDSNGSSTIRMSSSEHNEEECLRRKCHPQDKHYNIILLDHYEQAGLGDRLFVFRRLALLAGYLCAKLYAPPPYTMLASFHNDGQPVPKNLSWAEMEDIRFLDDNSSVLVTYELDPVDEYYHDDSSTTTTIDQEAFHLNEYFKDNPKYSSWLRLRFNDHGSNLEKVFENQVKRLDDFVTEQQQHDKPLKKGFIWEVYPVLYHYYDAFDKWRNRTMEKDGVCPCTEHLKSTASHQVKDRIVQFLQEHYPDSSHFVPLHIRRGDTKDVCDTSLAKMNEFLSCSFAGFAPRGKVVVLLATDERDNCYRQAIHTMIEDLGHGFLDLDTLVWDVLRDMFAQTTNAYLLNNMFVYKVISNIRDDDRVRTALEKRRDQCPDCQSLLPTLLVDSTTSTSHGTGSSVSHLRPRSTGLAVESTRIDLQAVLEAYEVCSKQAEQDTE